MGYPIDFGTWQLIAGDPHTSYVIFEGVDHTDKTFVSHIRNSAGGTFLLEWDITTTLEGEDTQVMMYLSGDTALGAEDGDTRKVGSSAVFDVQMVDTATEIPELTIGFGRLTVRQDITR